MSIAELSRSGTEENRSRQSSSQGSFGAGPRVSSPCSWGHFSDSDGSENFKLITHSKCCHQPKNNHLLEHVRLQDRVAMGFFSSGICSQTSSKASSTGRNVLEIDLTQNSRSGEQQVPGKAMVFTPPHTHTACKRKTEAQNNCHGSHTLSHSQSQREGVGASGFCSAVWEAKCDLGGECVPFCAWVYTVTLQGWAKRLRGPYGRSPSQSH